MKNKEPLQLSNKTLCKVHGGTRDKIVGGPIMSTCPKCGKEFKAGRAGVNHAKYPLKTMCDECTAKVEQQ